MRIIARKTLREFWDKFPEAENQLRAWFHEVQKDSWRHSADLKVKYRTASIINSERVVFNICGGKFRLIVRVNYSYQIVYVRFIGTHKEYDKINPETI